LGKTFRIAVNDKSYVVEVGDLGQSPIRVSVDGEEFQVRLEGDVAEVSKGSIPVMSMAAANPAALSTGPATLVQRSKSPSATGAKSLTAPMPGVVLAVRVKVGDKVKRGEEVCTLESMKMELNILAGADGVVGKVHVSTGQTVSHGTVLVEFE
jgi:glutaconyl-CoA/methylmalonyl-CoA decarboxylase subunit gamma